jgi:hypothetical protein
VGFSYCEKVKTATSGAFLIGYFQSYKYFEDIRGRLLKEVFPVSGFTDADKHVLNLMRSCESAFVHVRRGDYVTLPAASAHHGTCSKDYYAAAFARIAERVRNPVAFVFSDDPKWAAENIRFAGDTVYVNHNGANNAPSDLALMSSARHAIIANSSLSWWGAWLGSGDDRIVVAPKRWFADGRATPDLIPEKWYRL